MRREILHQNEVLLAERRGSVLLLTLNRPEVMNSLSSGLAAALLNAIERANRDITTRTIVIAGAGERAFCAGADLKERSVMSAEEKWAQSRKLWHVNVALRNSPKAVIAAIHGWCLGGGFELALYSDVRFASEDARFGFPEMTLGAFPGAGGAVMLPRIVGLAKAKEIFFSARRMTADDAMRHGIVEAVIARDALIDHALDFARQVECTSPVGLASVKRVVNEGLDLPFDAAVALDQSLRRPLDASEDYQEGMRAHAERRRPVFRGR